MMRREEKNLLSLQKILEYASAEFAEQGYGLSSVNNICAAGGISKGNLYHYFKGKDELYLACVQECLCKLTGVLRKYKVEAQGSVDEELERYFEARLVFFREDPCALRLFCGAVITPPAHLVKAIGELKAELDALNISILTALLGGVTLRADTTLEEVVEVFRLYQDFINARYQVDALADGKPERRERACKLSLNVLLYGVAEREGSLS